jgi:hypothetical protein
MGWFYGVRLPLIVHDAGELLAFELTPGPVEVRPPVPPLTAALLGQRVGDRGDISQALHDGLFEQGLERLTTGRKNLKNRLRRLWDKRRLRQRVLSKTRNDPLKNIRQIAHTRPRSMTGGMVNLLAGRIAYPYRPKKPSLGLWRDPMLLVLIV